MRARTVAPPVIGWKWTASNEPASSRSTRGFRTRSGARLPALVARPLFDVPVASVLLARDGTLLGGRIANDEQWRFPPLERVPQKFETAIMAFEDKRFREHHGVDPWALGRALYLNVVNGEVVSGASTLTMQVIRLARKNPERTYVQKLIEILLAIRLELRSDKDEILALYASHAPFGGNVVGLEAASWRYFARPPDRLSWAESSMLAVLPNAPALIHPGRRRDELKTKRDDLLRKLLANGAFSDLDLELALKEPLPDKPHPLPPLRATLARDFACGR